MRRFLCLCLAVFVGCTLSSVGYTGKLLVPSPKEIWKVEIGKAPIRGKNHVPVTIVVFAGFQCYLSSLLHKKWSGILARYKGKIRFVFKHLPQSSQQYGHLAAQASVAAHAQGKFWQYHDILFGHGTVFNPSVLEKKALGAGFSSWHVRRALKHKTYKAVVDKDIQQANGLRIQQAPAIFVNGRKARNINHLNLLIRQEIRWVTPYLRQGWKGDKLYEAIIAKGRFFTPFSARVLHHPKKIPSAGAPSWGASKPLATIVVFTDFQSEANANFLKQLRPIAEAYRKHIRVVYRASPQTIIHKDAHLAAQAAKAAQAQGKFWQYHDLLFANYKKLKRADLERYAKRLKLDMKTFKHALDKGLYKAAVDKEHSLSVRLGGAGFSYFVNGHKGSYIRTAFSDFKRFLDPILLKKGIKRNQLPKKPVLHIPIAGSPWKGSRRPLVNIVVFSDLQSSNSARNAKVLRRVLQSYKKRVRLVFKHFPGGRGSIGWLAAEASMAAHAQGQFWAYQRLLFRYHRRMLQRRHLWLYARMLRLDVKRFRREVLQGRHRAAIQRDGVLARKLGIRHRSTVFVNGRIVKASTYSQYKRILDAIWRQNKPKKTATTKPFRSKPTK